MDYKNIDVKPIAGAIGAEIFGVDLAEEAMAPEVFEEVHTAFLRHCVSFFRDQAMDDDVLARFGRRFGELAPLPPHRQVPGKYPELLIVETKPEDDMVFGWEWHSDTSHLETPTLGSILYAKVLPPALLSMSSCARQRRDKCHCNRRREWIMGEFRGQPGG